MKTFTGAAVPRTHQRKRAATDERIDSESNLLSLMHTFSASNRTLPAYPALMRINYRGECQPGIVTWWAALAFKRIGRDITHKAKTVTRDDVYLPSDSFSFSDKGNDERTERGEDTRSRRTSSRQLWPVDEKKAYTRKTHVRKYKAVGSAFHSDCMEHLNVAPILTSGSRSECYRSANEKSKTELKECESTDSC